LLCTIVVIFLFTALFAPYCIFKILFSYPAASVFNKLSFQDSQFQLELLLQHNGHQTKNSMGLDSVDPAHYSSAFGVFHASLTWETFAQRPLSSWCYKYYGVCFSNGCWYL